MKEEIISYLKEINAYKKVLEPLIDNLIFNIYAVNQCMTKMNEEGGLLVNTERDGRRKPKYAKSKWWPLYQDALKNMRALYNDLHLILSDKIIAEVMSKIDSDPEKQKKKEQFNKYF